MPKKKQLKKDLNIPEYVLDPNADINGTGLRDHIQADYKDLKKLFGEPEESDGYKVSGEWCFRNDNGKEVYTLYDWKSTSLYESEYPSVEKFRNSGVQEFNVGGHNDASHFIKWLENKLLTQKK